MSNQGNAQVAQSELLEFVEVEALFPDRYPVTILGLMLAEREFSIFGQVFG